MISIGPRAIEGYRLLHDGALALSRAEQVGLHIDMDYCKKMDAHLARRIKALDASFRKSDLAKLR